MKVLHFLQVDQERFNLWEKWQLTSREDRQETAAETKQHNRDQKYHLPLSVRAVTDSNTERSLNDHVRKWKKFLK